MGFDLGHFGRDDSPHTRQSVSTVRAARDRGLSAASSLSATTSLPHPFNGNPRSADVSPGIGQIMPPTARSTTSAFAWPIIQACVEDTAVPTRLVAGEGNDPIHAGIHRNMTGCAAPGHPPDDSIRPGKRFDPVEIYDFTAIRDFANPANRSLMIDESGK